MKNRFHGDCPATRTALSQLRLLLLAIVLLSPKGAAFVPQQEAGSIRGVVYDRDFDAPLPLAKVEIAHTVAHTAMPQIDRRRIFTRSGRMPIGRRSSLMMALPRCLGQAQV